jgi:hypothetical protein
MVKVSLDRIRRTVAYRATGTLKNDELKVVLQEAKWVTDQLVGGEHIVLADLRGMAPLGQEAQALFGEVIRYGRERGTALCIHLSDSSIAKLQANRLAREVSPQDTITTNVVSLDEAERMIEERYPKLKR